MYIHLSLSLSPRPYSLAGPRGCAGEEGLGFGVSIYLSIYLSIHPSIHPSVYMYISFVLYIQYQRVVFIHPHNTRYGVQGRGGAPAKRTAPESGQESGGTKRATSAKMPLLCLQSSEGKFTTSREIEPVRRSFCRHGSCTFTAVARLVPSGAENDAAQGPPPGSLSRSHASRATAAAAWTLGAASPPVTPPPNAITDPTVEKEIHPANASG